GWSSLFGFCYVCLFFFLRICRAVRSTVFPYTTLFRSTEPIAVNSSWSRLDAAKARACAQIRGVYGPGGGGGGGGPGGAGGAAGTDRKSTRLNSSHLVISYAVFCLKKKTNYSKMPPSTR